ncbi:glycosyltransferase family 39 protein [Aeromonas sp. 11P]|uniref:glycosyltransferase family 39 protein n=1 Tax=Aeromonas sp. 11P TaxID=3452713 RepID=UPI003F7975A8
MNYIKDNQRMISYAFIITVILVFLAGIILRFSNLDFASLWHDELYSVAAAIDVGKNVGWLDFEPKVIQELTYHDSFITWKAADNTPPLFESILILWAKIFGKSDFALRALPAFLGSLVPVIFYFGTVKELGKRSALLGSAFLAFSPTLIEYSQEVRAYMLACLLSTIAITLLVKYILNYHVNGKPSIRYECWTLVFVFIVLSYSHYTGFFTAGMLAAIYLLFVSIPQKRYLDIAKFLIVPALIAPWMMLSWKAFRFSSKGGYGWRDYHTSDIFELMIPKTLDFYAPGIGVYFALAIISIALFSIYRYKSLSIRKNPKTTISIALIIVIALLFLYSIYNSMTSMMWHPRYFVVSIPIVVMIVTLLLSDANRNQAAIGIFISIFIVMFAYADIYNLNNPHQKPSGGDYRSAAEYVNKRVDDKSIIALAWKPNAAYYLHYLNINSDIASVAAVFDVSYPDDIQSMCRDLNRGFGELYLIRHVTHYAIRDEVSKCSNIKRIETHDFSGIIVDVYGNKYDK